MRQRGLAGGLRDPSVTAAALLLVTILTAVATWAGHADSRALHQRGIRTTATIDEHRGGKLQNYVVVFQTAAGRRVRQAISHHAAGGAKKGDELDVIYDPEDPGNFVVAADGIGDGGATIGLVAVFVLLGLTGATFASWLRWPWLALRD